MYVGEMFVGGFEHILDEFSIAFDSVKPMCRKIRGILFPLLEDGALFKRTSPDPSEKL